MCWVSHLPQPRSNPVNHSQSKVLPLREDKRGFKPHGPSFTGAVCCLQIKQGCFGPEVEAGGYRSHLCISAITRHSPCEGGTSWSNTTVRKKECQLHRVLAAMTFFPDWSSYNILTSIFHNTTWLNMESGLHISFECHCSPGMTVLERKAGCSFLH